MDIRKYFTSAFVGTKEAAAFLGLSPSWLETMRLRDGGPNFYKLGRRVVYSVGDLETWAEARRRRSTGGGGKLPPP